MVTLPEIWEAQLQLLASFVSSDVVGGRAPLVLKRQGQTIRINFRQQEGLSL